MYKFAFTYLVKQDVKTWNEFQYSLKLLDRNILSKLKCKYKVLIFSEGEPTKKVKTLIKNLSKKNIQIFIKKFVLKEYVNRNDSYIYPKTLPHVSDCTKTFSLGYRDMCKFFAIDIFKDNLLKDTEYFIRLDTDSFFLNVRKNFLEKLENINCDYAFIKGTIQPEDKGVTVGFGNCLYNFCKDKDKNHEISKDYYGICQEATLKPLIFYTNFEVIKLDWIKKDIHSKLLAHITRKKGIYFFRWGDALIRYYVVKLLGASNQSLRGCLYKHSGLYDSRNIIRIILTKSYSKIRKRLHENNYEKSLSKLDKLFLGI